MQDSISDRWLIISDESLDPILDHGKSLIFQMIFNPNVSFVYFSLQFAIILRNWYLLRIYSNTLWKIKSCINSTDTNAMWLKRAELKFSNLNIAIYSRDKHPNNQHLMEPSCIFHRDRGNYRHMAPGHHLFDIKYVDSKCHLKC